MRRVETDQILNTLLNFSTPMFDTGLAILLVWQFVHARASTEPSVLAKHLLERRTRTLGRTWRGVGCLVFFDVLQSFDWRWRASNSATARERGRGVGILARPSITIASSNFESLADSKVAVFDPTRAEVEIPFGLRMRHARRFMALVVPIFGWRLWRFSGSRVNFPCMRIIEVFQLSVTLVVERIELCEAAVRSVPVMI